MYISRHFLAESKNIVKPCNILWDCGDEMARKTKNVTLSVHRAIFRDDISETLLSLISRIRSQPQQSNGHVIPRGFFEKIGIGYPHYPQTNEAISMRFAFYEEGSQKSTVTPPSATAQLTTNQTFPPSGTEFLNHEAVILVKGDYLISCGMGNRQNTISVAIEQLAAGNGLDLPVGSFRIADIPNKLVVDTIKKIGVKSIDMNISNVVASLEGDTKSIAGHLFNRVSDSSDIDRQNMVATLSLETKGWKKKRPYSEQPRNAWIDEAAELALKDDEIEGYKIVLNDGSKHSADTLTTRKLVSLEKFGSSFRVEDALYKMMEYLNELEEQGILK